jgi:2-(3-amino-3-carboxypropyl)histidine synthase
MVIESAYNLELEKVVLTINKEKAKVVCLQFPDGLKPKATEVAEYIEENTKAKCIIWLGTCFGACDIPLEIERLGVDLLVQFGHSPWDYKDIKIIKN